MVSSLVASRAEHSVSLWHPVVAAFPGANTVGEFSESIIKVSTPMTAKQIQPSTATDCYSMFKLSKRFVAVCAGITHIAYLLLFVWSELSERNPLNRGCHSHFSYNLKHHLAFPPTRHHRCKGCKKCCSLSFILLTCKLAWGGYCNYVPIMTSKRAIPITNTTQMIIIISILFSFIADLLFKRACYFQNMKRPPSN